MINTQPTLKVILNKVVLFRKKGNNIGIVTEGIGGSLREASKTHLSPEKITVRPGEYQKVTPTFYGESAHTDGTPPNPRFYKDGRMVWYRNDALVASSAMTNNLLRHPDTKLLSFSGPERPTGFTSVPAYQVVEMLIPSEHGARISKSINELQRETKKKFGVVVESSITDIASQELEVVQRDNARKY